ncbi:MAG: class I SAM-dependent methyltransferase [Carbonactinosporaceae bacterium]
MITQDGCAVDLWAALPAGDIPALLDAAMPRSASVLDLGTGAGRIAHPLMRAGHSVVAVDESPEMLAHIRGAETVCSTIEDLRLDRTFDVVLLASHLVNVPDDTVRGELLATCRHHVRDDGLVLIQRFTLGWVEAADGRTRTEAGITSRLQVVARPGPGLRAIVAEYHVGRRGWTQKYTTRVFDDDELDVHLARAGLRLDRWLSDDGRWVVAAPVPHARLAVRKPAPLLG